MLKPKQQNEMRNLVSILTEETQSLKEQYIQFTQEWATKEFVKLTNWLQNFYKTENTMTRAEFINATVIKSRLPYEIFTNDSEKFVENQIKNAEKHYEQSILKLATRVQQKGLNEKNLKATTSHIGVNIDTTLTDGEKSVRAFTIIAEGQINRPHYRYLIK